MLESMNKMAAESLKVKAEAALEEVKEQLERTRDLQKCEQEVYMQKQREWDDERAKMKEEKKRLEYMLYDMLKINDVAKEKLKNSVMCCLAHFLYAFKNIFRQMC